MIEDPRKQLNLLASVAAVKRIIGDQDLHVGCAGQRFNLIADHTGAQQQKESAPIGMDRVEKSIHGVLGHAGTVVCRHRAEQVLSSEDQIEHSAEHGNRSNPLLLVNIAAL
ncbi:MAG: hypothetical protein CSYNP_02902 [Syntrophus sp. SKADARSKE-3]|nr:hypothetical protein [Syntrophus sp. SKADARSKE-3]